ncbi:hypothetical protein ABPG75_006668 [Micractinium tetrahymenae]
MVDITPPSHAGAGSMGRAWAALALLATCLLLNGTCTAPAPLQRPPLPQVRRRQASPPAPLDSVIPPGDVCLLYRTGQVAYQLLTLTPACTCYKLCAASLQCLFRKHCPASLARAACAAASPLRDSAANRCPAPPPPRLPPPPPVPPLPPGLQLLQGSGGPRSNPFDPLARFSSKEQALAVLGDCFNGAAGAAAAAGGGGVQAAALANLPAAAMQKLWTAWKQRYNKRYKTGQAEAAAFGTFKSNVQRTASSLQDISKPNWCRFNRFMAGLVRGPILPPPAFAILGPPPNVSLSQLVWDWRLLGKVTPAKQQGETCNACWAFSAVAAVESAVLLATRTAYGLNAADFSEQEILDCVHGPTDQTGFESQGCAGGDLAEPFVFASRGARQPAHS